MDIDKLVLDYALTTDSLNTAEAREKYRLGQVLLIMERGGDYKAASKIYKLQRKISTKKSIIVQHVLAKINRETLPAHDVQYIAYMARCLWDITDKNTALTKCGTLELWEELTRWTLEECSALELAGKDTLRKYRMRESCIIDHHLSEIDKTEMITFEVWDQMANARDKRLSDSRMIAFDTTINSRI